mmetsp:Transcript_16883/g.43088  ORF Transcript_16883/g.43088 Transcript_16883/m.43088 type:complete len:252 (+) Transcript_16883:24-779(+)
MNISLELALGDLTEPNTLEDGQQVNREPLEDGFGLCTAETLTDGLSLLNETLSLHASPLSLAEFSSDAASAVRLINLLYALSQRNATLARSLTESTSALRTARRSEHTAVDELTVLKEDVRSLRTQLKQKNALLRLTAQEQEQEGESAGLERERLQRQLQAMKQRETQYKHALRKRDKELEELRTRLHKGLASKHPSERASASVTKRLGGTSGLESTPAMRIEYETLQEVREAYEARESALRASLGSSSGQ